MKKYILPIALMAGAMVSCSDEDKATQPVASISVEDTTVDVNTSIEVLFTGDAENVVVYPGDESHDYELRYQSNSGLVVNKGRFSYSYSVPGLYKLVCVATNHSNEGQFMLTDTCSTYIRVIDDITEIERLSAPQVLYDEVFATAVNDMDWLLALPRKMRYKTSNPTVSLQQRLKLYIPSLTTEVTVDGQPFDDKKKYNLANTLTIGTRSHEGSTREYKLHTLNYGEFKTFTLAGVKGTIERTEYDYSAYAINMILPAGTDVKSLVPQFDLYTANDKVFIGQDAQVSGVTQVDFSQPVTYRFVTTDPADSNLKIESTCTVAVTLK